MVQAIHADVKESRVPAMAWVGAGEMAPTLYHQPCWRTDFTVYLRRHHRSKD